MPGNSIPIPEQARPFIDEANRHLGVFDNEYAGKPYEWKGEHELNMAKVKLLTARACMDVTTLIGKVNERLATYKESKSIEGLTQ